MTNNIPCISRSSIRGALAIATAVALSLTGCHNAQSTGKQAAAGDGDAPAKVARQLSDAQSQAGDAKGSNARQDTERKADDGKGPEAESDEGVTLKPEEIQSMGIVTSAAQAAQTAREVQGFGVVLAHETIATAVAEIRTAAATQRQSRLALERSRRLSGTPGAMPAEVQEAAERQAVADQAALELARQKLSSSFGQNPPWNTVRGGPNLVSRPLAELASGHAKLVHVTFPLGSLSGVNPTILRLARIDASQGGQRWQAGAVWPAPADATVPGRSYFAILNNSEAGEGDHLLAWTPVGQTESGVLIPASAAVVSGGRFWCYVERKPGIFVRAELDPGRALADGYFVKDGVAVGDKVVTAAAGQLLAREMNPSKEAED